MKDPHRPTDGSRTAGPPGMPRWVKVFAAIVALLVLALVVSKVLGADHGPGMHASTGAATPVTLSTEKALAGLVPRW